MHNSGILSRSQNMKNSWSFSTCCLKRVECACRFLIDSSTPHSLITPFHRNYSTSAAKLYSLAMMRISIFKRPMSSLPVLVAFSDIRANLTPPPASTSRLVYDTSRSTCFTLNIYIEIFPLSVISTHDLALDPAMDERHLDSIFIELRWWFNVWRRPFAWRPVSF